MDLKGRITERSLYPHLTTFLENLGFNSITEVSSPVGQLDIIAKFKDEIYVIEVKIGEKSKKLMEGLSQAMRYSKEYKTHNILVFNYPPEIHFPIIENIEIIVLDTKVDALVFTQYLNYSGSITPKEVLFLLKEKILQNAPEISIKPFIEVISQSIQEITSILRKISTDDMGQLIKLITGKYDLFMALSELKNKEDVNDSAIDLIGYILINQILFYHIYSARANQISSLDRIPQLSSIINIKDLDLQLENIKNIDYKAIYQIDVLSRMPENDAIVESINKIIDIFTVVKPERVEHDLIGRLFHDLLPQETRKILAAFYTNPIAADILSCLSIDEFDSSVMDLSCGSGTLLVASYNYKKYLANNKYTTELHKKFVEEDLTGLDIMPFAAHLTAVNLSSQSFEVKTDHLRIGVMDSLSLSNKLKHNNLYTLQNFSRELQTTFDLFDSSTKSIGGYLKSDSTGAVSANAESGEFKIRRNSSQICIMNPPFSDREKMPNSYLRILDTYEALTEICGSRVNLWGYFLALCDLVLKSKGTFGFVIPINFFRGRATEKIRNHILKNYSIKYIIKTGKDIAFSENASFRDILLIAKKIKPKETDKIRFVIINEYLHDLSLVDARNIGEYIKGKKFAQTKNLDIVDYAYPQLLESSDNLMPFFGLMSTQSSKILIKFNNLIKKKFGNKLRKIKSEGSSEGFHASPKGISQMAFITKNIGPNRVKRAFLILKSNEEDHVEVQIKGLPERVFTISKTSIKPAFRTLTDINSFDITDKLDYIITDKFEGYEVILNLSNIKDKNTFDYKLIRNKMIDKETNIVVARRFRPNSDNTSNFAFSSETSFIAPHTFKSLKMDLELTKITSLFLNSVIGIMNLVLLKEQTTEAYTDIMESDLILMDIIDIKNLTDEQKLNLFDLYDSLKSYEFTSLIDQFENSTPERTKLDNGLLEIMGLSKKEIIELLPEVYKAIVFELRNG